MSRIFLLLSLFIPGSVAAMCLPEDCELLELRVSSCEDASAELNKAVLDYAAANKDVGHKISEELFTRIKSTPSYVIRGTIARSRTIDAETCAGVSKTSEHLAAWADNKDKAAESFVFVGSEIDCATLSAANTPLVVLKSGACCDTVPPSSAECLLHDFIYIRKAPEALQELLKTSTSEGSPNFEGS